MTAAVVVTPSGGHALVVGNQVTLAFSSGNLFTPGTATSFNATYTITAVAATTYTVVPTPGAGLPATGTGSGFVLNPQAITYAFTQTSVTTGDAVITPTGVHSYIVGSAVSLSFTSGKRFE